VGGVQLVGGRHDDARLLEVGLWVEDTGADRDDRGHDGAERPQRAERRRRARRGKLMPNDPDPRPTRWQSRRARAESRKLWVFGSIRTGVAQDRARLQTGRRTTGPLAAVPVGIKDVIETVDMPPPARIDDYRGNWPSPRRCLRRA